MQGEDKLTWKRQRVIYFHMQEDGEGIFSNDANPNEMVAPHLCSLSACTNTFIRPKTTGSDDECPIDVHKHNVTSYKTNQTRIPVE